MGLAGSPHTFTVLSSDTTTGLRCELLWRSLQELAMRRSDIEAANLRSTGGEKETIQTRVSRSERRSGHSYRVIRAPFAEALVKMGRDEHVSNA